MRQVLVRAALAVVLSTAGPAASAAERTRSSPPDLSARPPERDPRLLLLGKDPDLHARAVTGRKMVSGGAHLVVVGALAVAVGLFLSVYDSWSAGAERSGGEPLKVSPRGPLVALGGVASIVGGVVLVRAGDARTDEAVRAYAERERAARQRP